MGNVLAWAGAGNPELTIVEFFGWVKKHPPSDSATWQSYIRTVGGEFGRLNRICKEIGGKAGEDVTTPAFIDGHLSTMLICGLVNKESAGFIVRPDGKFQSLNILNMVGIGSGGGYADAVYQTIDGLQEKLGFTDEQAFEKLMYITSLHADRCSLPFDMVKISQGKITRSQSIGPEPGVEDNTPVSTVPPYPMGC